jgi:hypothetical protein
MTTNEDLNAITKRRTSKSPHSTLWVILRELLVLATLFYTRVMLTIERQTDLSEKAAMYVIK